MNHLKQILFIGMLGLIGVFACNNAKQSTDASTQVATGVAHFGQQITEDGAMPIADVLTSMKGDALTAKMTGTVESVCKVKGCWMTLKRPDGESMRVTFKDYGFFVPKDIEGKTAIVEGVAEIDTVSVDMLRHFAEDEGLPQAEIDKITEPEIAVSFVANGVILK